MKKFVAMILSSALAFGISAAGTTAVTFGLSTPVVLGMVGLAIDYNKWTSSQTNLQGVADQAALSSARELRLASPSASNIQTVAQNYVLAALKHEDNVPTVTTTVAADMSSVTVDIVEAVSTVLAQPLGLASTSIHVKAKAKVSNGPPLCLLILDPTASNAMEAKSGSVINATGCATYSNSKASNSIAVKDSSVLRSAYVCACGG